MRVVTTEDADAEYADASASVDVVYEHELAPIGMSFGELWEFAGFRAIRP
jgi:hypothetical protein